MRKVIQQKTEWFYENVEINEKKGEKTNINHEKEDIFSDFQLTMKKIYSIIDKYLSILMNLE